MASDKFVNIASNTSNITHFELFILLILKCSLQNLMPKLGIYEDREQTALKILHVSIFEGKV